MNLFGRRIKSIHLRLTLPLTVIWLISLTWSVNHHLGNERNRLDFLASGVRGVAEKTAAMIEPASVSRISCEFLTDSMPANNCTVSITADGKSCNLAAPCNFRYGGESARIAEALREALSDLNYLPYFSELYKKLVLKRAGEKHLFEFRVELQRQETGGNFIQVGAIREPPTENMGAFGLPVAQYARVPGALAQAQAAWASGEPAEWITRQNYQLLWPLRGAQGTSALLAIEVEREQRGILPTIGLVLLLSVWFIGVTLVAAATTVMVGTIWLFNALTIWGVGAILVVLALLIWYRINGGFGSMGGRGGRRAA